MLIKNITVHRSRQFNNPCERFKNERISVTLEAEPSPEPIEAEDADPGTSLMRLFDSTEITLDKEERRLRKRWADQLQAENRARDERLALISVARGAIKKLQGRDDWDAEEVRGEIDLDGDDIPF